MNLFLTLSSLAALLLGVIDAVQIDVDTSQAPDLENFGAIVKETLEAWYPYISANLTSPTFVDIDRIPIFLDPNYDGVAYASGGHIVGSVKYYTDHQDDIGSMIHEMTHVIQGYRNGPGWLVEGIADYIRFYHFEETTRPSKPGPNNNYTDAYRVTAYFLNYIVNDVRSDIVYWSNRGCREGTYADSIWEDLTYKNLNQLWADMMNFG